MSPDAREVQQEESTDGEFKDSEASVTDEESDAAPTLYSHGMTERKLKSKSVLPEEYDADLYLLRRSVSLPLHSLALRVLTPDHRDEEVKLGMDELVAN